MDYIVVLLIIGATYLLFMIFRDRFSKKEDSPEKDEVDIYSNAETLKNENKGAAHPRD